MKMLFLPGLILIIPFVNTNAQNTADSTNTLDKWSYHFQLTTVWQAHPRFRSPYSGLNSLYGGSETALSLTTTLFTGRKLWKGAAIYFNPEIAGGEGMSGALGIAGYPNGETFRIGNPAPALYVARAFIRQHIAIGKNDDQETLEADVNQLQEKVPASRIDITAGKLAVSDIFDANRVSDDPRVDFLNWSLMNNGAWDYPANTRGYTYLVSVELIKPAWALRFAEALVATYANGPDLDWHIRKAHSETIEWDKTTHFKNYKGNIRILGYANTSKAPSYRQLINDKLSGVDTSMNAVYGTKYGGLKYGFGLNIDQQLSRAISFFSRIGWNDGKTATWAFTEIDQTVSAGLKISGNKWDRADDYVGVAAVFNGISKDHRDFLNNGGYGFMIGDGKLPHYGPEGIIEIFYEINIWKSLFLTADYQFIHNPAYNKDRGPVNVFGLRTHEEL